MTRSGESVVAGKFAGRREHWRLSFLDPASLFMAAYGISSVCGLAMYLRSDAPLTVRGLFGSVLYHGVLGLATALVIFELVPEKSWLTIGFSMLVGLSGMKAADLLQMLRRQMKLALRLITDGDNGT